MRRESQEIALGPELQPRLWAPGPEIPSQRVSSYRSQRQEEPRPRQWRFMGRYEHA